MHWSRRLSILIASFVQAALVPTGAAANFNPPKLPSDGFLED